MTHHELLTLLNSLPNYSEPAEDMEASDRAWLCDFRLRVAAGQVPTVADEDRLVRIANDWDEA